MKVSPEDVQKKIHIDSIVCMKQYGKVINQGYPDLKLSVSYNDAISSKNS